MAIERLNVGEKYINKIRGRLLIQNKNWLSIVCGDTGSGKSYCAISLADQICPRGITIKRNVVFNPIQFMERLNNVEDLKKGDILIFDEAGVGMSSREWYSMQNKLLGSVLQTFRNLNVGVIFTTPNLSFIDIQARKLFHSYFETANIDYKRKLAYVRVYDIDVNSRYDKTYYKHPKFLNAVGRQSKCSYIAIPKPRPELIEEYERVKRKYTLELNAKALQELTAPKDNKSNKHFDFEKVAKEIIKNKGRYFKQLAGRTIADPDRISIDYELSRNKAITLKKYVEDMIK